VFSLTVDKRPQTAVRAIEQQADEPAAMSALLRQAT
jgi:hypothetical protein